MIEGGRNGGQIVGLDALRFVAASMVMVFHLAYWRFKGIFPEVEAGAWFGSIGVHIFFVISGFVIAYSAEGTTWRSFAWRRALRLYPALLICMVMTATVLWLAGRPPSFGAFVRSLAFWPAGPYVDGVYWTLAVEVQFYATIGLLLAVRRYDMLPALLGALLLICGAGWGLKAVDLAPSIALAFDHSGFLKAACHFVLGGALFLCSRKVTPYRLVLAGGALAVGCVSLFSSMAAVRHPSAAPIPVAVYVAAVCVIIVSVLYNQKIRIPYARQLGLVTYPLYLLHNEIGAVVQTNLIGHNRWAGLGLAMASALALSFVVTIWLEPFVRNTMAKLSRGRTAPALSSAQL